MTTGGVEGKTGDSGFSSGWIGLKFGCSIFGSGSGCCTTGGGAILGCVGIG